MSLPDVASREEWLLARKAILAREKELTRQKDALNADRRRMPMVAIEKDYEFEGPEGTVHLLDLFAGKRQLVLQHFMFDPSWDDGCSSCTAGCDEISDGLLEHLGNREAAFTVVGRAPYAKIAAYKKKRGWTFPFVSSTIASRVRLGPKGSTRTRKTAIPPESRPATTRRNSWSTLGRSSGWTRSSIRRPSKRSGVCFNA
jgi:predicted dithiol-disulfide oxidoreductase (DUF899 family)